MTTILNLPEEILRLIFEELWSNEQQICQKVCKAWYLPAHKLVLKKIDIPFSKIQRFISSIDCNPDPTYLNSVKSITIGSYGYQTPRFARQIFDKESIEKTLCRFPNLKDIKLDDSTLAYDDFNDDVCKNILYKCSKLGEFKIKIDFGNLSRYYGEQIFKEEQDQYLDAHYKLRLLLTRLDLREADFSLRPESAVEFISNFPRLKEIHGIPDLNKFEKLLSVLGQLRNVQSIEMEKVLDDQENFAETCISSRAIDEQKQLIKSLSSVKMLDLRYKESFGVNSINFIANYFTGLHNITIASYDNQNLTSLQEVLLGSTLIDLLCNAKKHGRVTFSSFKITDLSKYLPIIVTKLFQNFISSKVLEVKVATKRMDPGEFVHLAIESDRRESLRKVTIYVSSRLSLHTIATDICSKLSPTNGIDTFTINIDEVGTHQFGQEITTTGSMYYEFDQMYSQEITTTMYDEILSTMPSLREIQLEIPSSYVHHPSITVYPLIERVTLQATAGEKSQETLDTLSDRFPNLKQLDVYYFCGTWNKESHEYQVTLHYSLESLVLDLTPAWLHLTKYRRNEKEKFIAIQVSKANSNVLYKIQRFRRTEISENDLIGFKNEEDFYRIHVTVNSLKRFDAYLCLWYSSFEPKYASFAEYDPRILIFNNTK